MTSSSDNGSNSLRLAGETIDRIARRAEAHHAKVEELQNHPHYSHEYRQQLIAQEERDFNNFHREEREAVLTMLHAAEKSAARHLSCPGSEAIETRKARASVRVSRLIDGGMAALDAAEMFAQAGDLDALRALRDEIPSWVAATLPTSEQGIRQHHIDATLLGLDRLMAPLLDGDDAAAVNVRLSVDGERARLEATTEHAMHNSAGSLIKLAYAGGA